MSLLTGKRILVTRSRSQASKLSSLLRDEGAIPVEIPVLAVEPVDSPDARALAERVTDFDGLVFTSQNGVKGFSEFPRSAQLPPVYAVGPSTAAAVKKRFGVEAIVPESNYVSETLVRLLVAEGVEGKSFLLALAEETRDVLARGLEAAGATVSIAPIYRTVRHRGATMALLHALGDGLDAVTVASSKTMEFLHRSTEPELRPRLKQVPLVSIGPITSATAIAMGYDVAAEAENASVAGLIAALKSALAQ